MQINEAPGARKPPVVTLGNATESAEVAVQAGDETDQPAPPESPWNASPDERPAAGASIDAEALEPKNSQDQGSDAYETRTNSNDGAARTSSRPGRMAGYGSAPNELRPYVIPSSEPPSLFAPPPTPRLEKAPPVGDRTAQANEPVRRRYVVHLVEKPSTLQELASEQLGDPGRWREIYDLNRTVISDPAAPTTPGVELIMPRTVGSLPAIQR